MTTRGEKERVQAQIQDLLDRLCCESEAEQLDSATGFVVALSYSEGRKTHVTLYGPYATAPEAMADASIMATDLNAGASGDMSPYRTVVHPLQPRWSK